jgi:hypothetical protein
MRGVVTLCNSMPIPSFRIFAAGLLAVLAPSLSLAWPQPELVLSSPVSLACENLSAEPITYGMQYDLPGSGLPDDIRDIHDVWLAGGCVGCHNQTAMGELRLDDPQFGGSQLVSVASFREPTVLRVKPGDPESSLLYAQINCLPPPQFPLMPPQEDQNIVRIPARLRALVYDWIAQGARGVDGDGNPLSDIVFGASFESVRAQRNLASPSP